MKLYFYLPCLLLLYSCEQEHVTQNYKTPGILDISVGKVFPHKPIFDVSETSPIPVYSFRAPNQIQPGMPFYDFDVSILRHTGKVQYVMAERAYSNPQHCIDALVKTKSTLLLAYPNIKTEGNSPISHKEGDIAVDLACRTTEGARYMVLSLSIHSQSQTTELINKIEANKSLNRIGADAAPPG